MNRSITDGSRDRNSSGCQGKSGAVSVSAERVFRQKCLKSYSQERKYSGHQYSRYRTSRVFELLWSGFPGELQHHKSASKVGPAVRSGSWLLSAVETPQSGQLSSQDALLLLPVTIRKLDGERRPTGAVGVFDQLPGRRALTSP